MTSNLEITRDPDRGGYLLHAECIVPRPLAEVFPFFADARNLQRLTPPWVDFRVLTQGEIEMRPGALIDYKLRIRGLPIKWRTEITAWEPQHRFVDEMLRGPYRWWRHEHLFEPCDEGTRVIDKVQYGVPGGAPVHWLLVGRDVRKIFAYRQQSLREIFATPAGAAAVA
ncbi:MAG: SRPBCC family protein [Planctomycetales bacterium]|nr:SRPBCC family protein [Planctomycetales bacterium]